MRQHSRAIQRGVDRFEISPTGETQTANVFASMVDGLDCDR